MTSYAHCPTNSLPTTTHASTLTPNTFHKLCPAQHPSSVPLGQPQCGDGTPFSFFYSRPPARLANANKILIEFQGGGACWDENTCGMQYAMLTWPEIYDNFIGKSCSEIDYGLQSNADAGTPISMLCAKSVGETDFREYNTVIIPYCTQDVHIGDSIQYYGDDTIRHVGAHNMWQTLQWVFTNFPNPTHIFLTGCSAGGTAVPIAYDLIQKHYNSFLNGAGGFGVKAVDIGVIMDSSVYLTPDVFLEDYIGNWETRTIMKKIRFNFDKYRYESNYPDLLWQHILRRGPNTDRWGFVTHSVDPISLMYYQYMGGNGNNNNARLLSSEANMTGLQSYRQLEDDLQSEWRTNIQTSMNTVKRNHNKNVDFYIIDGEGHCSFGLYYPLQDEGFQEWAAPIVKERKVFGNSRPSAASFLISIGLGGLLLVATLTAVKQQNERKLLDDEAAIQDSSGRARRMPMVVLRAKGFILHQASRYASYPWTSAYICASTLYFICMLILQGFAHPLENPTLGPSAVGLSLFGINNPSLIVYKMQYYRLFTSTFLCSGVISYLMVLFSMYRYGASLEWALIKNGHAHWVFVSVLAVISLGVNLAYACLGNGASCTSLALTIGLNVFSGILHKKSDALVTNTAYPTSWGLTTFMAVVGGTPLFSFDSIVTIATAIVIGFALGWFLFNNGDTMGTHIGNEQRTVPLKSNAKASIRWNLIKGSGAVYAIMYLLILFRIPSPDKKNVYPYLTGCNLIYSDQIGDFVKQYASNYGGRDLEGNDDLFDGQNMCAQLCVPHLVYRPLVWGVRQFGLIALEEGTCEENGYYEHVADKTVREYTVTLEVQVFAQSEE